MLYGLLFIRISPSTNVVLLRIIANIIILFLINTDNKLIWYNVFSSNTKVENTVYDDLYVKTTTKKK